jgi:hypothetical protein
MDTMNSIQEHLDIFVNEIDFIYSSISMIINYADNMEVSLPEKEQIEEWINNYGRLAHQLRDYFTENGIDEDDTYYDSSEIDNFYHLQLIFGIKMDLDTGIPTALEDWNLELFKKHYNEPLLKMFEKLNILRNSRFTIE